ncbi:hypothetical protein M231_02391 [Tremella mesenterica]|uniref:ATP-dependent DNA helicase n=1 Tax=Tremella mesenterica TaxID=5217 RepID=A0A4V1M4G4_TREME|nr:hypothetical protein M231_02391 [Tremella mesenterica]
MSVQLMPKSKRISRVPSPPYHSHSSKLTTKLSGKRTKYYGVKIGRIPGVYKTWEEAEVQKFVGKAQVHTSASRKLLKGRSLVVDQDLDEDFDFSADFVKVDLDPHSDFLKPGVKPYAPFVDVDRDRRQSPDKKPRKVTSKNKARTDVSESVTTITVESAPALGSEPVLSFQQQQILERILAGENFFFTGSAGTGKSVLLRAIIREFNKRRTKGNLKQTPEERVEEKWRNYVANGGKPTEGEDRWTLGVTASTGMAAINIGGSTVHSWAGIGLGQFPVDRLVNNIRSNNVTRDRWQSTHALVIDEISMIDGKLFDKLEEIARKVRNNNKPFGGLQLIVSGDFFQLPPVAKPEDPPFKFAFEAKSWSKCFPRENMMALTRVFRQKEDVFVRLLESMRKGHVSMEDTKLLRTCNRVVEYTDGVEAVGLYPSKNEVETINRQRLAALNTPLQEYLAHDAPGVNSKGYDISQADATAILDKNTIWVKELSLKVGALVMLVTVSHNTEMMTDSIGKITDFMTLSEASSSGVYLPPRAAQVNAAPHVKWPVVEFVPSKYATNRIATKTIIPQMCVDVLNAMGTVEAERHQIPLILAWALTIHKSQGQTIERVKIDLNKIFVQGQTYVAISRAVSLENLEIRNFAAHKVMAHQRVIAWAAPFEQEQAEDEHWDELLKDADFDF